MAAIHNACIYPAEIVGGEEKHAPLQIHGGAQTLLGSRGQAIYLVKQKVAVFGEMPDVESCIVGCHFLCDSGTAKPTTTAKQLGLRTRVNADAKLTQPADFM